MLGQAALEIVGAAFLGGQQTQQAGVLALADLPQVQRLAADSPVGVTSLPDDAERLRDKILASEASFAAEVSYNGEESYFFVLEDSASGELVGCSAIVASAGFSEPFYSFRNETFVHASRSLSIHNKIHVLSLCHDLTGNSLLTSFYVQRDLVQSVYAELNSRGRLLFMASHPERFADAVVVEIVGYSDEQGESPFWNAVGRNFFDLNYIEAEKLSGLKSRTFLAELMPHYPIYVPLLPDAAQESMGQVHPRAQITFDILMREASRPTTTSTSSMAARPCTRVPRGFARSPRAGWFR